MIYREQVVLCKVLVESLGGGWFRINVGELRIGIRRGTGRTLRTVSVERQVEREPTSWDAGRKPPNHTCCVHTHARTPL